MKGAMMQRKRPGDKVLNYSETIREVSPGTWAGVADFNQGGEYPGHEHTLRVTAVSGSRDAVARMLRSKAQRLVKGRPAR